MFSIIKTQTKYYACYKPACTYVSFENSPYENLLSLGNSGEHGPIKGHQRSLLI